MTRRKRLSTRDREALLVRESFTCHLCGLPIVPGDRWEVSHEIALACGGEDIDSNRRAAHWRCHAYHTATETLPAAAKARRIYQRHHDMHRSRRPLPAGRGDRRKRTIDGRVIDRVTGEPWA